MSAPLIAVIIPIYNGDKYFLRYFVTLDVQQYPNLELIFVDNNSTDHLQKMVKQYCKFRQNTLLLKCEKQGSGAARNVGLKKARGEYISFLDVDKIDIY